MVFTPASKATDKRQPLTPKHFPAITQFAPSCPSTQTWRAQTSTNSRFVYLTRRHDHLDVVKWFNRLATSPRWPPLANGRWNTLGLMLVSAAGETDTSLQSKGKAREKWEEEVSVLMAAKWQMNYLHSQQFTNTSNPQGLKHRSLTRLYVITKLYTQTDSAEMRINLLSSIASSGLSVCQNVL